MLAPATLAALPSTRAIPDRDVFYVADPCQLHSSITRPASLVTLTVSATPAVKFGCPCQTLDDVVDPFDFAPAFDQLRRGEQGKTFHVLKEAP